MYDIVDRNEIDRLVSILRKGRFGADVTNQAANLISELTEENFNLRLALRSIVWLVETSADVQDIDDLARAALAQGGDK